MYKMARNPPTAGKAGAYRREYRVNWSQGAMSLVSLASVTTTPRLPLRQVRYTLLLHFFLSPDSELWSCVILAATTDTYTNKWQC
jgi:hypothetical protein